MLELDLEQEDIRFAQTCNTKVFNVFGGKFKLRKGIEDKIEEIKKMQVRFRTIGDATCTGAVASTANTLEEIIEEVASTRITERGGRSDDKRSEAAMEDRKKEGYF